MNIWIVNHYATPPGINGMVRHYYFSKNLQEKGHKVHIITSSKIHNTDINLIKNKSLYVKKMIKGVRYIFVRSRDYHGNGISRILNLIDTPFQFSKVMRRFYKQQKPDVIYSSSPDLFVVFFSVLFSQIHRIPSVVEIRDLWPESIVEYYGMNRYNPIIMILYQLEKWVYKKADQLIFTMEGGKQYICDREWDKDIDLTKVSHINNGVDLKQYQYNEVHYQLKDKDLEDDRCFKVVYTGSIRRVNNIRMLVEVGEELKKRNENEIKILIYGDGTDKEKLEKQCIESETSNVLFKGRVDNKYIPYILSKCDLNLSHVQHTDLYKYGESLNKQFDYFASGKPILSNNKTNYSLIQKYCCGTEENILDVKQYADMILKYKNMDPQQYKQECENAKQAAVHYDYAALSNRIEEVCCLAVRGKNK